MMGGAVLGTLLSAFGAGWSVSLHKIPSTPDMAAAPLQPLVAVCRRLPGKQTGLAAAVQLPLPVQMAFKYSGGGPDASQVSDIVQVPTCPNTPIWFQSFDDAFVNTPFRCFLVHS